MLFKHQSVDQALEQAAHHHQAGRLREAEQLYQLVLSANRDHAVAIHNLGLIAHQTGRRQVAVDLLRRAVALNPKWPEAFSNLGNVLRENGQFDEAIDACLQAIALRPAYPEAYNNLGFALDATGRFDDAIVALRKAIALKPAFASAYNNLGNALRQKGQFDEALNAFRQAIALSAAFSEAYNNLGTVLLDKGEIDQAISAIQKAIALRSNYPKAYNNLGNALKENESFEAAVDAFQRAIELQPDLAEAHCNLGMELLARGDFQKGWQEYEWRWRSRDFQPRVRIFSQPQWDGNSFQDRVLLLHPEQGYGDAIQFIRFLPQVLRRGGKVIVECQPQLLRLFNGMDWDCQFIANGDSLPDFDVQCPLLSLPRMFNTTVLSLPQTVPYLRAYPDDVNFWRERLVGQPKGLKVGLAWTGRVDHRSDRNRATELGMWKTVFQISGVRFFSLHKTESSPDSSSSAKVEGLVDWTCELNDFADTAALISNLDLVISVDTATAHLAGALGKPVWTLLRTAADWRWLRNRDDSPWYPTMRLFRQSSRGDWREVVERIAKALSELGSL